MMRLDDFINLDQLRTYDDLRKFYTRRLANDIRPTKAHFLEQHERDDGSLFNSPFEMRQGFARIDLCKEYQWRVCQSETLIESVWVGFDDQSFPLVSFKGVLTLWSSNTSSVRSFEVMCDVFTLSYWNLPMRMWKVPILLPVYLRGAASPSDRMSCIRGDTSSRKTTIYFWNFRFLETFSFHRNLRGRRK